VLVIVLIIRNTKEHYKIATDTVSQEMFTKLKNDLSKLYPSIDKLDLKGLVSCVPEDSFTENKKRVCICLRNKSGEFYSYSKLLKIGIHELAHVISTQHDPEHKTVEFITNYNNLINRAIDLGFSID